MKFILKNVNEKTDFWLLTSDMVSLLEQNGIKYSELNDLGKKVDKLTFDEVGSFFLLQRLMSKRLGKPDTPVSISANSPTETAILNKFVVERGDVEQYFIDLLQKHNTYFYKTYNDGIVIMLADKNSSEIDYPGWTLLDGDKLSIAIVSVIYKYFGYQDVHFLPVVQTGAEEFTLSNAFYALEQGL